MARIVALYQKPRTSSAEYAIGSTAEPRKSSTNPAYQIVPAKVVVAIVRANNRTCSHTRSWNFTRGCQTTGVGCTGRSADVLEVFAGLEPDGAAGRDPDFLSGPWIAADAALARF